MSAGYRIRQFFDELFTSRYVRHLEAEVESLNSDREWLRSELKAANARLARMELSQVPQPQAAKAPCGTAPVNPRPRPWSQVQAEELQKFRELDRQEAAEKAQTATA